MKTNLSKEMDSEMLFDLIRKANRDKDAAFELGAIYMLTCINVVLLILNQIY